MRHVTFLRLSLLGPLVLPPLAMLLLPGWFGAGGLIMTVGIMYYGIGYVIFAVGVLVWLARPRSERELGRAVMIAPAIGAPVIAMSGLVVSMIVGDASRNLLPDFALWLCLVLVIGYAYALLIRLVGRRLPLRANSAGG